MKNVFLFKNKLSFILITIIIVFLYKINFCISQENEAKFNKTARILYIKSALIEIQNMKRNETKKINYEIFQIDKNQCHSIFDNLRLSCLINEAQRFCSSNFSKNDQCHLFSDISIISFINEDTLISSRERYELMAQKNDYRKAIRKFLNLKYATIVTEFYLSKHLDCNLFSAECLAPEIDFFCRQYTNTHNLSWEHCASGIIWFISTSNDEKGN